MVKDPTLVEINARPSDVIAAPGWAAVYIREGREFVWPLVAWLRPEVAAGRLLVGLALSLDGRSVVPAEQIEGFKCYLPPAAWFGDASQEPGPARP